MPLRTKMRFAARSYSTANALVLGEFEAPLLPNLVGILVGHAPLEKGLGRLGVLAVGAHRARIGDGLAGVVGHHRADGDTAHTVHIGGIDHGNIDLTGLGVLAHVAHLAAEGHLRLQGRREFAALARGIGTGGPVGLDVAADRRQGLAGIVAIAYNISNDDDGLTLGEYAEYIASLANLKCAMK